MPRPLALEPENGMRSIRLLDVALICTGAEIERLGRPKSALDVSGEDAGGEPEGCSVGEGERALEGLRSVGGARTGPNISRVHQTPLSVRTSPSTVGPTGTPSAARFVEDLARLSPSTHQSMTSPAPSHAGDQWSHEGRLSSLGSPDLSLVEVAEPLGDVVVATFLYVKALIEVQTCPAFRKAPSTTSGTARSRFASSQTTVLAMLPISNLAWSDADRRSDMRSHFRTSGERVEIGNGTFDSADR